MELFETESSGSLVMVVGDMVVLLTRQFVQNRQNTEQTLLGISMKILLLSLVCRGRIACGTGD